MELKSRIVSNTRYISRLQRSWNLVLSGIYCWYIFISWVAKRLRNYCIGAVCMCVHMCVCVCVMSVCLCVCPSERTLKWHNIVNSQYIAMQLDRRVDILQRYVGIEIWHYPSTRTTACMTILDVSSKSYTSPTLAWSTLAQLRWHNVGMVAVGTNILAQRHLANVSPTSENCVGPTSFCQAKPVLKLRQRNYDVIMTSVSFPRSMPRRQRQNQIAFSSDVITSPPEGVARYCFHPVCVSVCLSVCLCICVSGQYFGILFLGY